LRLGLSYEGRFLWVRHYPGCALTFQQRSLGFKPSVLFALLFQLQEPVFDTFQELESIAGGFPNPQHILKRNSRVCAEFLCRFLNIELRHLSAHPRIIVLCPFPH